MGHCSSLSRDVTAASAGVSWEQVTLSIYSEGDGSFKTRQQERGQKWTEKWPCCSSGNAYAGCPSMRQEKPHLRSDLLVLAGIPTTSVDVALIEMVCWSLKLLWCLSSKWQKFKQFQPILFNDTTFYTLIFHCGSFAAVQTQLTFSDRIHSRRRDNSPQHESSAHTGTTLGGAEPQRQRWSCTQMQNAKK